MSTKLLANSSQHNDLWMLGLLLLGGILLLPNLASSGLLWQDEAETAVLGKNILTFGYPKVFDGVNRLNPGLSHGPYEAWAYHPWLSFYLAALSFWMLGPTTEAARFPFALIGVASLLVTYRLALRLFGSLGVARLASVLTLLSVPLLLHLRQCRYYAPAVLATLWVLWAYLRARDGHRAAWGWLGLALAVLFHSHHGVFAPTALALALDTARRSAPRKTWPWMTLCILTVGVLTLPWVWILDLNQHVGTFSWKEVSHHGQFYLRQLNRFVIPLVFLGVVWLARGIRPRALWRAASPGQREGAILIALVLLCNLAFLVVVPWQRHFRYLIHLIPLLAIVQAICLWGWLKNRPVWLAVVCTLLVTSDLLHYSAPYCLAQTVPRLRRAIASRHGAVAPRSLIADYLYEWTHPYRGPLEGIIETLERAARPGETVKIPYGDHAVIFYTGLKVEDPNRFTAPTTADWIIPRRDWVPGDFYTGDYFRTIEQTYDRMDTDAPDLVWENRPDPGYHRFRTERGLPTIMLYHRRKRTRS